MTRIRKSVLGRRRLPARPAPAGAIRFGVLKGRLRYPDDLDAPLPRELLDLFEGKRSR